MGLKIRSDQNLQPRSGMRGLQTALIWRVGQDWTGGLLGQASLDFGSLTVDSLFVCVAIPGPQSLSANTGVSEGQSSCLR